MTARFTRLADGLYVQPESGLELVRSIDDSDGYNRIEWQVWTPLRGRCLALRGSLHEAKARAREIIEDDPEVVAHAAAHTDEMIGIPRNAT